MKQEWIFSVEELNEYVRRTLTMDPVLNQVKIRGEISNFKSHSSGHWYFSLKDEKSRINCVMFRQYTYGVKWQPKDGQQVVLQGNISLFVRDGTYQFYAEGMEKEGAGDLYQRFERLKVKLAEEGLFDQQRKRALPLLPRKIGIVTSLTGAVLHDIYQIAQRRFPNIPMVLMPVAVQGDEAPGQIAKGIEDICEVSDVDVIIVGRGGGSLEDLWAFNEEVVAKAIFNAKVPVVSAVGHETDTTIADFVADKRAATPSMAAELVVPMKEDLLYEVDRQRKAMVKAIEKKWLVINNRYNEAVRKLEGKNPLKHIDHMLHQIQHNCQKMNFIIESFVLSKTNEVKMLGEKLHILSPVAVLERGYAIVKKNKKTIDSLEKISEKDEVSILFKDGKAKATITQKE